MKRYLVFHSEDAYRRGGWADLTAEFDTFEDAVACAEALSTNGGSADQEIIDTDSPDVWLSRPANGPSGWWSWREERR